MTIKKINGTGRNDVLRGGNGTDWIDGGNGDDQLYGAGGADMLTGGRGRDTLDGGSGSDYVDGGEGDDLLVYSFAENRGAYDVYNGWTGSDTLRLVLTAAEWDREDVRQDVHRFLRYLPEYNEPNGWISDPLFSFRSTGLSVVGVNKLEVVVDGKAINATDRAVTAVADLLTLSEDDAAGATVNLLANDLAPDGVRSVRIAQPKNGTVELVSTDFAGAAPSAQLRFKPDGDFDHLKEGETATEVFTYTVVDKDGDEKTATVTVTVTGANDVPVVKAVTAAVQADGMVTGDVAATTRDADGDRLSFAYDRWSAPVGFEMNGDGTWSFDPHRYEWWQGDDTARAVDRLKAGETMTFEVKYYAYDPSYAVSEDATLTITVTGVNDPAVLQNLSDEMYEDRPQDWTIADGVHSQGGLLNVLDWDAEYGDAVVTLVGAGENNLGRLVLTGFDEEEGRYGYRYEIDSDAFAALAEREEKVETFRFRIDDGRGSVTYYDYSINLVGDGNDPVEVPDWPMFGGEPVDADGYRTVTYKILFQDYDHIPNDHSATVAWVDPDALGDISVETVMDEDWDFHVLVTARLPLSAIDALDGDLRQSFRVELTDNAGSTGTFEREGAYNSVNWYIGEAADERIVGSEDAAVRDVLIGGEGADQLVGGAGADRLYGDEGPALPEGEDGGFWAEEWMPVPGFQDELDGGAGADRLTGGAGADRFVFRPGEADGDVVVDFSRADGDRIALRDWAEGSTLFRLDATRWEIRPGDGSMAEVITLANGADLTEADFVFERRPVDWQVGGVDDDRIAADNDEHSHVLVGGGGRDYLRGGEQADRIFGDEGPDLPAGQENLFDGRSNRPTEGFDDKLDGEGGADELFGGDGADLFVFDPYDADGDVVLDFDGEEGDRLDLSAWGSDATLTHLGGGRWEIRFVFSDEGEIITLSNGAEIRPEYLIFDGQIVM